MTDSQGDKLDKIIERLDRILEIITRAEVPDPTKGLDKILQALASLSGDLQAVRRELTVRRRPQGPEEQER
jgi:hypothetical protein